MSDGGQQKILRQSLALVLCLVLSSWSMAFTSPSFETLLEDAASPSMRTGSFNLTSGYGHDIAGSAISVDGLDMATVRPESLLDYWWSEELNNSSVEHHGTPDMTLTRHNNEHYCWSTEEGPVRTALHRSNGLWQSSLVDNVTPANTSTLVDCAIAVTPAHELPRVLYADGPNLKMGRYAMMSQTYWDGPKWHTRTILENVYPTSLELEITPGGVEWGLMRTQDGVLHQVNFSGAYWTTYVLDAGPVGEDIELQMDENGVAHILYLRTDTNEVVLLRVDGFDRDERVLKADTDLVDAVGMDLDGSLVEQVATSTQEATSFSIELIRSLAGQDTGRVDPTPVGVVEGEEDVSEGSLLLADLNDDGLDDLLVATPEASLVGMTSNGRVDVFYGTPQGVSSIPDVILTGANDDALFGSSFDVGDVNNDGIVDLVVGSPGWHPANSSSTPSGQVVVYLGNASGLSSTPWTTVEGSGSEGLGGLVTVLAQTNAPDMVAAVAQSYTQTVGSETHAGKVNIYMSVTSGLVPARNLTQSMDGNLFGRSMEACDVDGDGYDDLIVGNTGSYDDINSYSSIEYFYGSLTGYDGTPDRTVQSLTQGKLLGYLIACVGDVNGDGIDDHIITEPYNSSGAFGSGALWLFEGAIGSMSGTPDWFLSPSTPNARIGEDIVPAGDVNEDGYDDVYISSNMGSSSGMVQLFLGSASGLRSEGQLLASGSSGQRLGAHLAGTGDVDGDGLSEVVYSLRNTNRGTTFGLDYIILTERDWESLSFTMDGDVNGLELATAARGETSIVFSHTDAGVTYVSKLEHMNDGTPTGQWVRQTILNTDASNLSFAFEVRSTGQPVLITEDGNSIDWFSTTSMTAVVQDVATTGTVGQYLGSSLNQDGEQVLAYTSGAGLKMYAGLETSSGWSNELVRSSVTLASPISVVVDSANVPHFVYRHADTDQLEMAVGGSSWSLETLGDAGEALSLQHPAVFMPNGTLAVALVTSNGTGTNLSLWMHDGSTLYKHSLGNFSDTGAELSLALRSNGSLLVASLTTNGYLQVQELWPGSTDWQAHTVTQPSGSANEFRLDLEGGDNPVLAVRGNAASSIFMLNQTYAWNPIAQRPDAAANGAWDIVTVGEHLLLLTSDPTTQHLVVNTLELDGVLGDQAPWMSVRFGDVVIEAPVSATLDADGTVKAAYWDTAPNDVRALRLYEDSDRDLVFDLIDALPEVGDQWLDSDGDNYGDNPLGPLPDDCPTVSGSSSFISQGCEDVDSDGFSDSLDACNGGQYSGTSWIDRFGCQDYDQDGWSDNVGSYVNGDRFYSNWKQALDTDGDGFGDNHGTDCCSVPIYDPNAGPGDLFPYLESQYADYDGDGYGDNDTDLVYGDYCPWDAGTSFRDRNGCLDTDGDGSSDPSDEGTIFEWNADQHGADRWPLDPTQWADTDGDGFGDNQSANATTPDRFPYRQAAANDTDGDGFADNWTAMYDGSNGEGIQLDACPLEWGNSTLPVKGCLDSDGDMYTDQYSFVLNTTSGLREQQAGDAFPSIKDQWLDTDGDGFGDNPAGFEGDVCPFEAGVAEGTHPSNPSLTAIGCRVVDVNDEDNDGVINDVDACSNTPAGETVNAAGCGESQLDDDDDGVSNLLDLCPNTAASIAVDAEGCSTEQRTTDSDGDGLNDPEDACPNTATGDEVDERGCSQAQRDTDGDGIVDLDDACDDTPPGFPILENGCTDESALDLDLDGDGYAGVYTYDIDPDTGLHVNQTGDAFPTEPTQWFDQDNDGYGDNPNGTNADECPEEAGTSYIDYLGCYDDGDGWRDDNEPVNLRGDPTQWSDTDRDGFGDNYGDASLTATRDPSWPGVFVEGATNVDLCPRTPFAVVNMVDEDGCHPTERDSDNDGVVDADDNCPEVAKGVDGYDDGCPYIAQSGDGTEGLFGIDAGTLMLVAGGGGALLLLLILVSVLLRRERDDDDEDEYDDGFDDDDEEESVFDRIDRRASTPLASRANAGRASSGRSPASSGPGRGPRGGPQGGPIGGPQGGPAKRGGPAGGPSQRSAPSGPPGRSSGGPPGRSSGGPPGSAKPAAKVAKKKSVTVEEEPAAKVRKAKIVVDLSIFEDWQVNDRTSAVDWVVGAMSDGEQERGVLMQLQETGWTAEQSRAIWNLAKNKAAEGG